MAENNGLWPILQSIHAANDDLLASGCATAPFHIEAACDDPCGEAGYDGSCRDASGALCPCHDGHCRAPDFPCKDLLRHALALEFLERLAEQDRP